MPGMEAVIVAGGGDLDPVAVRQRGGQVTQLAVDLDPQRGTGEPLPDRTGGVRA